MSGAKTATVKYTFLDIVAFTKGRSVEAQSDLIDRLNSIVLEVLEKAVKGANQVIYLPTGDGICIALIDIPTPYDIHLQVALNILQAIEEKNSQTEDQMRQFQVRIGLYFRGRSCRTCITFQMPEQLNGC